MKHQRPQWVDAYVSGGEVALEVADQMGEEATAILTPARAIEIGEALIRQAKEVTA